MAGEFSRAAAGLNVGTLTINLALNTGDLKKGLDETNKQLKSMGSILKKEFEAAGGTIGNIGEKIGNVGKNVKKMFGDEAPLAMQKFGKEMAGAFGLGQSQVKGLAQSVEALEGAFKIAGIAATVMTGPLGIALAVVVGMGAAVYGVIKAWESLTGRVFSAKGALQEVMQITIDGFKNIIDVFRLTVDRAMQGVQMVAGALKNIPGGSAWGDVESGTAQRRKDFAKSSAASDASAYMGRLSLYNQAGLLVPEMGRQAMGAVNGILTPGVKGEPKLDTSPLKVAEAAQRTMAAAMVAIAESEEKNQNEIGAASESLYQAQLAAIDMENSQIEELHAEQVAQADLMSSAYRDAADVTTRALADAAAETKSRWDAVGSGQLGTATGTGGVGGAIMNIAGGAASQYKLTGTAMQGAAQGGAAGGPWGAVIGALVALASQTSTFTKLMGSIEGLLEGVLPILDTLLRPIMESIDSMVDVFKPLLKIISIISDVLSQALKPIWSLVEAIGSLLEGIGSAINAIDLGGLTGALDKSLGGEKDQWGKYTFNDWATIIGPLIGEAGYEIDKAANGGVDKETRAAQAALQFAGPSANVDAMLQQEQDRRRAEWDMNPNNPYFQANMAAKTYFDVQEALNQAKQNEVEATEKAAEALRQLSDELYNAAPGFKVAASIFGAQDMVGYTGPTGNPF